ncbi:MAG: signal peptidase I [Ruminiclostridium sp.]
MKKVLKGFVSVLSWVVLVFALIMTIFAFSVDKSSGISNLFGFIPLTVESDSMAPTFVQSDLIIDREIDDVAALKEGDVITFWTIINGNKVINTHRITEVHLVNGNISFTTKGDNNDIKDSLDVYPSDIVGKWTGVKVPALGGVIGFLRTQLGFCICVIIPLALFFLFELYKFIAVIIEIKRPAAPQLDEEEIKRRAIEEYLAEQKQKAEQPEEEKPAEEATAPKEETEENEEITEENSENTAENIEKTEETAE